MNFKFDKKAQIGTTLISIVTLIVIILLLIVFIIGSTFITKLGKVGPGEIGIIDEEKLGIRDVVFYPYEDYLEVVRIRNGLADENGIKELILENGR